MNLQEKALTKKYLNLRIKFNAFFRSIEKDQLKSKQLDKMCDIGNDLIAFRFCIEDVLCARDENNYEKMETIISNFKQKKSADLYTR